jgi:hypothetical protein
MAGWRRGRRPTRSNLCVEEVEIGEPESVTAVPGHIAGAAPSETAVVEVRTGPVVEV